jgi:DNA-binding MarR family transcriptional regulator
MSVPFERPPTLLGMPTYLASWVAKHSRADMQQALGEHGLMTADFGVLVALADLGPLSQQQLADRLATDKSQVVRLIDQLEQRKLVTRAADPDDRRRHRIELTEDGRELVGIVAPIAQRVDAEFLGVLSPAERRALGDLLRRVLDAEPRGGA